MKRDTVGILVFAVLLLASQRDAFAQYDSRGCSQYGTNIYYPQTLESSLWTFRSNVWDGYIDFQEGGKYLTHWGYGTWTVNPDGESIHLANDYNSKTYEVVFTDSGFRFKGLRDDGLIITGDLLCAQYQGPGPQVPQDVADQIKNFYLNFFEREPDQKELLAQYRLYIQGKTVEEIQQILAQTPEFKKKQEIRQKKIEAEGGLQY